MQPRINFVTLVVADLERARRFYLQGLGWQAALDVAREVAMIHVGNKLILSLWAETAARAEIGEVTRGGTLPFTLAHNVAGTAERREVPAAPRQRAWGGYSGYFLDPDGFRWEVAFNPHPIGDVTVP